MKQRIAQFSNTLRKANEFVAAVWRDRALLKTEWEMLKVAFPLAVTAVHDLQDTKFFGATRTQIAFQKVQYELKILKVPQDDLTGAMVFVAVSLAYLFEIKGLCKPSTGEVS